MQTNLMGNTAAVVRYALDGLSLRHAAIAANIANANSVGYRPLKVSFEDQLMAWTNRSSTEVGSLSPTPLPRIEVDPVLSGGTGTSFLERETVALNQNVIQYEALIRGLNRQASILTTAISEGKR